MKKFLSSVLAVLLLIICLSVPAFADAQLNHVTDDAGILYDSDIAALEERAAAVSEQYDCGVYIVTVGDFTDYSDAYYVDDFGQELFSSYDLGLGDDNCGILLILSMAERDYGLVPHGDFANTAFTDYGKDALAEYFLDDFRNDDWYQGFADYIDGCEEFMRRAADGQPVDIWDESPDDGDYSDGYDSDYDYDYTAPGFFWRLTHTVPPLGWLIILGIPALIALTVCLCMKRGMKTAVSSGNANLYIRPDGVRLTRQNDIYTHTTVTRTQNVPDDDHNNSGGGGTTVNSGGFSSSHGKF